MDGYIYLPKDAGSVHDIQPVLFLVLRERERSGYFIGICCSDGGGGGEDTLPIVAVTGSGWVGLGWVGLGSGR